MPDVQSKTNDQLLDRLAEIDRDLAAGLGSPGDLVSDIARQLFERLAEVGRIHIELARRTAGGWRPL